MIHLAPKNSFTNHTRIRIACKLDGERGDKTYLIGDRLQGKITLTPSKDLAVERIIGQLVLVVKSAVHTGITHAKTVTLAGTQILKEGKDHHFSLLFIDEFDKANFSGPLVSYYWRFTATVYLQKPEKSTINNSIKNLFGDFRPASVDYKIPVSRSLGHYSVQERNLPIQWIKKEYYWGMAFSGLFVLWMLISTHLYWDQFLIGFRYFITAASILASTFLLITLSGFQAVSLSIKPGRDRALRVRFMDLGNKKYDDQIIGYRIVSTKKQVSNSEISRSLIFDKAYPLSSLTKPGGLFREAVLPWPKGNLPTSQTVDEQGFIWEVYLRTNVFPFGVQEQAWPVEVGWEAFRIPEVGNEGMEKLELQPLKEAIEQRR